MKINDAANKKTNIPAEEPAKTIPNPVEPPFEKPGSPVPPREEPEHEKPEIKIPPAEIPRRNENDERKHLEL